MSSFCLHRPSLALHNAPVPWDGKYTRHPDSLLFWKHLTTLLLKRDSPSKKESITEGVHWVYKAQWWWLPVLCGRSLLASHTVLFLGCCREGKQKKMVLCERKVLRYVDPPDGGWGWMIVVHCFLVSLLLTWGRGRTGSSCTASNPRMSVATSTRYPDRFPRSRPDSWRPWL